MFEIFGSAGIKAKMVSHALNPMSQFSGVDINKLPIEENFELQENAFRLLQDVCGKQKKYTELEYVCVSWLALLNTINENSKHSLSDKASDLKNGFKDFLSDTIIDPAFLPSPLAALLEKYSISSK